MPLKRPKQPNWKNHSSWLVVEIVSCERFPVDGIRMVTIAYANACFSFNPHHPTTTTVPPTIIESQSTRVADMVEHSDVALQCKANGHPKPTITWRRDDGSPIRLNGQSGSISNESANQTSFALLGQRNSNSNSNSTQAELLPPPLQQMAAGQSRKYS